MVQGNGKRIVQLVPPGVEPTGKLIQIDGITVIEFRDGLMSAERLYWDEASALRQLGKLLSR